MNFTSATQSDTAEQRFTEGDRTAFNELYELHASELLAILVTRLKRVNDAEDLLHDVWAKVWKSRDTYRDGSFRGWVLQIARTTLLDEMRRKQRRHEDDVRDITIEP